MTDREPAGQTNTSGPQSYASDAEYWFTEKPTYMWSGRIRGLFAAELGEWLKHAPADGHVIQDFEIRRDELHQMNDINKESWATHLTEANTKTFQKFVDRENRTEWLTAIIEAEANRENPRTDRIAYVNKRKQEL